MAEQHVTKEDIVPKINKPNFVDIVKLEPEMAGFSLHVRVHSVKRKLCREALNGQITRIYEAVVHDDTASITMTLKGDDQISAVKPGDNLILRNVRITMHQFHMRLSCDRWGLIEKDPDARIKPPLNDSGQEEVSKNVSDQEYERISDTNDDKNDQRRRSPNRGYGRGFRGNRRGFRGGFRGRRGFGRGRRGFGGGFRGRGGPRGRRPFRGGPYRGGRPPFRGQGGPRGPPRDSPDRFRGGPFPPQTRFGGPRQFGNPQQRSPQRQYGQQFD